MVLLFGAVAVKTLLQSPIYRSEAKLLMRLGRETVNLDPTATVGEVVNINRSYDWEVNSETRDSSRAGRSPSRWSMSWAQASFCMAAKPPPDS